MKQTAVAYVGLLFVSVGALIVGLLYRNTMISAGLFPAWILGLAVAAIILLTLGIEALILAVLMRRTRGK